MFPLLYLLITPKNQRVFFRVYKMEALAKNGLIKRHRIVISQEYFNNILKELHLMKLI